MLRNELYWKIEPHPGVWDWSQDDDQIWLMKQAEKRGVHYFWSAAWSMPAWMKDNNDVTHGGHLKADNYQDYADYLARYVEEYRFRFGLTISAISVANEPDIGPDYQSSRWSGEDLSRFIGGYLGPTLARKHLDTKVKIVMPESAGWPSLAGLADATMGNPEASRYVGVVAAHQYDQTHVTDTQPKFPPQEPLAPYVPAKQQGKELWETEVSFIGGTPDPTIKWGLGTALLIHNAMVGADVESWQWWALLNSWKDNEGLADLSGDNFILTKRLYCLGNFSKFVRPGFERVEATSNPASGVLMSAYREPESGSFSVVVINLNEQDVELPIHFVGGISHEVVLWITSATLDLVKQAKIAIGSGRLKAKLPGRSVVTFVGRAR